MIRMFMIMLVAVSISAGAQTETAPTAATKPANISVQEMLVSGPPQLKMHSLAMISQGSIKGSVDESYLPGFKVCSEDVSSPIRSITAQLLGQYFVQGNADPNTEAVELLVNLATDESKDVSYNAAYYGLSQIQKKSDEIIALLVDAAAANRDQGLLERVKQSLESDRDRVIQILDEKLAVGDNVAVFEIYEDLTGKPPANADKYLDMPSSRPRMFIFKGTSGNPDTAQTELEKKLRAVGIQNPNIQVSGSGDKYVLMVKTYITKEGMAVEKNFSGNGKFRITQQLWLTPEMEIQLEAMQKAQRNSQ